MVVIGGKIKVPPGFWMYPANHLHFFEWAAGQLNVQQLDDWYNVTLDQIEKLGGLGLLVHYYKCSLQRALATLYPDHEWLPWRFRAVAHGFWADDANRRHFFEWAARQLNIRHLDDWYKISLEDMYKLGAAGFFNTHFKGSLIKALEAVYPEHEWLPWRFEIVPRGFWSKRDNQRKFFEWCGRQLGVAQMDDWYAISQDDICKLGGTRLLNHYYGGSLAKALSTLYPEHEWLEWRFRCAPMGFWKRKSNHRRFFEWAALQLNIHGDNYPAGWYSVTNDDIIRLGGGGLLRNYYMYSLPRALIAVFPEVKWEPWRFQGFRSSYNVLNNNNNNNNDDDDDDHSNSITNNDGGDDNQNNNNNNNNESFVRRYVEYAAKELRIERLDEWYRVSLEEIRDIGGFTILAENGGLIAVLKRLYPEHHWDENRFAAGRARSKKSKQRRLRIAVEQLYPGEEVFEEYAHPALVFEGSNTPMVLDVYIPSLSLAFEYQGEQHYRDLHFFGNSAQIQSLDTDKALACQNAGITIIAVPYWWDKSAAGLADIVRQTSPTSLLAAPAAAQ